MFAGQLCSRFSNTDWGISRTSDTSRRNTSFTRPGASPGIKMWGGQLWRARSASITGVWGQSPQRGPEAEPLVRGSRGQSLFEAERFLAFGRAMKRQICLSFFILEAPYRAPGHGDKAHEAESFVIRFGIPRKRQKLPLWNPVGLLLV